MGAACGICAVAACSSDGTTQSPVGAQGGNAGQAGADAALAGSAGTAGKGGGAGTGGSIATGGSAGAGGSVATGGSAGTGGASLCDVGAPGKGAIPAVPPAAIVPLKAITACGDVTDNVILESDLIAAAGQTCLTVKVDGVMIDGNGKTITTSGGLAIEWTDHANVRVRNVNSNGGLEAKTATAGKGNGNIIEGSKLGGIGIFSGEDAIIDGNVMGSLAVFSWYGGPPLRMIVTRNTVSGDGDPVVDFMGGTTHPCPKTEHQILGNTFEAKNTVSPDEPKVLYLRCGTHNIVRGNVIHSYSQAHGLRLRDEADFNTIENNTVWVNNTDRGALHTSSGNPDKTFPSNNTFRRNIFRADQSRSLYFQAIGDNNLFDGNLFWANEGFEGARIAVAAKNTFQHNTFVNTDAGTGIVLVGLGPPGSSFQDNVFVTGTATAFGFDGPPDYSGYTADYNVFFDRTGPVKWGANFDFAQWKTTTGQDQHSIEVDPLFVAPSTGDFRLQTSSPVKGLGSSGSDPGAYPLGCQ
jgi:hypothetical protein